jgi:lipopolysaccharide/colanic/teichoic acid biosynthesis glycosyltransferase
MWAMATETVAFPTAIASVETALRSASRSERPSFYEPAKRALDVVLAATLLLMLLPVFAVVAIAILLETGRPIFYRAERVGRFAKPFRVAKFRSMRCDADQGAHAAFIRGLLREQVNCAVYKVPNDTRITRVGAFLRRTSIDELPQLWNVIRGEMSIVGPRPDVPYAVAEYSDWIRPRLVVRPGITGLWQVSGRSRLSLLEMYRLDVDYVANASLGADLSILLRTVPVVLGCGGAA